MNDVRKRDRLLSTFYVPKQAMIYLYVRSGAGGEELFLRTISANAGGSLSHRHFNQEYVEGFVRAMQVLGLTETTYYQEWNAIPESAKTALKKFVAEIQEQGQKEAEEYAKVVSEQAKQEMEQGEGGGDLEN